MIKVNDKPVSMQEAVNLLIVCHLQFGSCEIREKRLEMLMMATSHTGGVTYDTYRGSIAEMKHLVSLAYVLVSRLAEKPSHLDTLTQQELNRIFYHTKNGQDRAKVALAVMGRSQMDDDVILKFSLKDLCTAYAFFAEANRAEQSYIFDGALQLSEPIGA